MSRSSRLPWLALVLFAPASPGVATAQFIDADVKMVKILDKLAADDKYPLRYDAPGAKQLRDQHRRWHLAGTLGVFDKGPNAKAAWAPQARVVFEQYAQCMTQTDLCGNPPPGRDALAEKTAQEAVAAGCDDPLVRYRAEQHQARFRRSDPKVLARFRETVAALDGSAYADRCKLTPVNNWLAALTFLPPGDPLRKDEDKWEKRFWELFERVAAEKNPVAAAEVLRVAQMREEWRLGPDRTRRQNYQEVARHLEAAKAVQLVVHARLLRREGWEARGEGAAATVTPAQWAVFRDRLTTAKEKAEEAWDADQTRHEAAADMVDVCRGLGLPRDEMELWFARALAGNPDNRLACIYKLEVISPRWGGSAEGMAAFVWMCARSENAEGLIPMSVLDYHLPKNAVVGPAFEAQRAAIEEFYGKPVAWVQVQAVMEGMLKADPTDAHLRTLYARLACVAGRHAVAVAQFEKLAGKYDARFFPEKDGYERYVEAAKQAAIDPAKLVGQWTAPDGAAVEFTKDGAFTITVTAGQPPAAKGEFLFVGNSLQLTFDKGEEARWTASKLTADAVTLKNAAGQVMAYKRAKGK